MDYETLIYKLGSLHTLLRELGEAGLYQGEHTIAYSAGNVDRTIHVYIDGTDLQMSDTPMSNNWQFSTGVGD